MRIYSKIALLAASAALVSACSNDKAQINCTVSDAPSDSVIVKLLDVNTYNILDTVATSADGSFTYKVDVKEGEPEFVYIFKGDDKIASLILKAGDNVRVKTDSKGNTSVEGSEESEKLLQVEKDFTDFISRISKTADGLYEENLSDQEYKSIRSEISRQYVQYYRKAVGFITENPFSLVSIPVLYQEINEDFPVFSQYTDALHFRSVCDSLKTLYPESRYVKALEKETVRRENLFNFQVKVDGAPVLGFPEISLPDVNGQKVPLSSVDAKVIMVHFWHSSDVTHKILNNDSLKPLYEQFHDKGFEIYSVCLDNDKAMWAKAVKSQELPWINVNDGLGQASPAVSLFGVTTIPSSIIIADGSIVEEPISGEAQVRAYLNKILK